MKTKFKSEYFKGVAELTAARDNLSKDWRKKRDRVDTVRKFSNGLSTLDPDERRDDQEITNYLTAYRFLLSRQSRLYQTFTATDTFVEFDLDTGNEEKDLIDAATITDIVNRKCLYDYSLFRIFIRALAGEIQISGGSPVGFHLNNSWVPKLEYGTLFPKDSSLSCHDTHYAFIPQDFSLADLKEIRKVAGDDSTFYDTMALDGLIEYLKNKPSGNSAGSFSYSKDDRTTPGGVDEDTSSETNPTVTLWNFYEVGVKDNGESVVSRTLFNDKYSISGGGEMAQQIIFFDPAHQNDVREWLHMVALDMEVGGDTTVSSVRGMAEIIYPSSTTIEALLSAMVEGDTERARPRYSVGTDAVADDVLKWDPRVDTITPQGITSFKQEGSSAGMVTPLNILMQNASGLGAAPSAGGGELRVQAIERGQANNSIQYGDLSDWANSLHDVMVGVVNRLMTGKISPRAKGYRQAMLVRKELKDAGIDVEKIFKKEHGEWKHVTVRVTRPLGEGSQADEMETSKFLLEILPLIPPDNRPIILRSAITARTKNPNLARTLISLPPVIASQQKLTAENEADTIFRRALIGHAITTNPSDIHQDHIPVHMLDLTAVISRHQLEPWKKLQALQFAGLVRHTLDHIEILLGAKQTADEGQAFIEQLKPIIAAGQAISNTIQDSQDQSQPSLTPAEQAQFQLKTADLHLRAQKLGLDTEALRGLEEQRRHRMSVTGRQAFMKEMETAARMQSDKTRLALEQQRAQAGILKTQSDIENAGKSTPSNQ